MLIAGLALEIGPRVFEPHSEQRHDHTRNAEASRTYASPVNALAICNRAAVVVKLKAERSS